jgi:hypothetical protein
MLMTPSPVPLPCQIVVAASRLAAQRCGLLTNDSLFMTSSGKTGAVAYPGVVYREILSQVRQPVVVVVMMMMMMKKKKMTLRSGH